LRVALVVSVFPSREHPYIWDWACELVRNGVDLHILTEQVNVLQYTHFQNSEMKGRVHLLNQLKPGNNGAIHTGIPFAPEAWVRTMLVLQKQPVKLRSKLLKFYEYLPVLNQKFDLIHFNAPQIAVRRFEMKDIFQARALVSFRGQDFSFYPTRYDGLLKQADHLHFISTHLLALARSRGYEGTHHSIIPPVVDTNFYRPCPEDKNHAGESTILFTAARLEWVKGFEFALQAVAILKQRGLNVEYYIAGEGEFKEAMLYTIDQLGLQDCVHLLGWQNPDEIRGWMWKSDLYILASVSEAFNNSVLQAQACGLPVVCSDEGGLPENIADGETGLLFHRRDAWDMAEKIQTLLRDNARRSKMSREARNRVEINFSQNNSITRFGAMYDSLVG